MQDPSNRPVGCHPVSAFRHGTAAMGVGALAVAALLPLGCNGPLGSVPARRSVGAGATPADTAAARASTSPNSGDEANTTWTDEVSSFGDIGWDTIPLSRRARGLSRSEGDGSAEGALSDGGGNLAQVSFATDGGDYAPDVDRTGTFMVYASTQHRPTFDIYRKSVDGRTVTQLTTDPSDDLMPALAPDGSRVAFASNRNGNWDIYVMPIGGGAPTQITADADEEVQPTCARRPTHRLQPQERPDQHLGDLGCRHAESRASVLCLRGLPAAMVARREEGRDAVPAREAARIAPVRRVDHRVGQGRGIEPNGDRERTQCRCAPAELVT